MFLLPGVMRRRRVAVAAGLCLSFFLGTLVNLLYVPGFEHQQARFHRGGTGGDPRLLIGEPLGAEPVAEAEPPGPGSLQELRLQVQQRHDEVLRYRQHRAHGDQGVRPLERRRLMDLEPAGDRARGGFARRAPRGSGPNPGGGRVPVLGCGSISNVTELRYLGSGYTKTVHRAALNRSFSVALKSVDLAGHDMERCVERYRSTGDCYTLASFKILKEMVLMQALRHPNVVQLYGYCYQVTGGVEDAVTAITELGTPLEMIQLLQSPWEERFRICLSLARLLHFLSRSPLGSVSLLDFRPRQFVLVGGELKVSDLDDASAAEDPCPPAAPPGPPPCTISFPARNFSLPCSRGRCVGLNEKRNLYNAYRFFFTYLLPHSAPAPLRPLLDRILNATGELQWGVEETLLQMEKVLHLYRTGSYLNSSTHTHTADYQEVSDSSIPGQNYRCWPSYQHDGCLLSVFSLQEALATCRSHLHCRAFVFTNQSTWTGRQMVFFKSGSAGLSHAPGQLAYVRLGG